jgi:Flp pilus assembly protein TadD
MRRGSLPRGNARLAAVIAGLAPLFGCSDDGLTPVSDPAQRATRAREHVARARTLVAAGKHAEARVELAKSLEQEARAAVWVELGHLLREHLRDPRGGREAYVKALELEPGHVEAHLNLGLVLLELGDAEGARAELESALSLAPPDAPWRATAQEGLVRAHVALSKKSAPR